MSERAGGRDTGNPPLKRARLPRVETTAGGVIFRWIGLTPHILLIRDGHSHWGLPKGHLETGETPGAAALRASVAARYGVSTEPDEETGLSDADLFLTGKDEETLTAQAKRLAKRVSDRESTNNIVPTEGATPRAVPDEKSAFADFLTGHRTA